MPVTATAYTNAGKHFASALINWTADTIKVALCTSTYTPNLDTHDFFDDITGEVAAAFGYTAGGATLGTKTATVDAASDETRLDAADVAWSPGGIASAYAIVYKSTGTASTSPLIALINFGGTANIISLEIDPTGLVIIDAV